MTVDASKLDYSDINLGAEEEALVNQKSQYLQPLEPSFGSQENAEQEQKDYGLNDSGTFYVNPHYKPSDSKGQEAQSLDERQESNSSSIKDNKIVSFAVTTNKKIDIGKISKDFSYGLVKDDGLLVTIATTESNKWEFDDSSPDVLLYEIASKIKSTYPRLKISAIELLAIGYEIGKQASRLS